MAPADLAAAHYEQQARQAQATAILVARQWRQVTAGEELEQAWSRIAARVTLVVASGMLGAARAGASYVPAALDREPVGAVDPTAWSQTASDGRPLDSLLYSAVVRTRTLLGGGTALPKALEGGGKWLDALARTQVADADRGAVGAAIAATPGAGWVRYVSPPCCQRCAILAGRRYRWSDGFRRHPRCDCRHAPVLDGAPAAGLTSTVRTDQIRDLTAAQRQAVDDGADLAQVVNAGNARRGRSADGMTTSEGTTRRGYAATRLGGRARLTPEAIYRVSATREEAVRLLNANGYIVGDPGQLARRLA